MSKKKKPKIQFRYYRMPEGTSILALLDQKWLKPPKEEHDYLHIHNYLEIGYCHEGEGTLTLGEQTYRFKENQFTVIPKSYPHTTNIKPGTESTWSYLYIDVKSLLQELYPGGNAKRKDYIVSRVNSQAFFRNAKEAPKVASLILEIFDIMRETKEFYLEEAKGITSALLVNISRENNGEKVPVEINAKEAIPISRALDYITLHYMEPLKVEELANWCHISETHFRRVFFSYMNMSPLEYINLVRVQTACDLLKRTDEPITTIAGKCGFTTLSTFNRNFKQITGVSPSQWRKRPENFEQQLLKSQIHLKQDW